MDVTPAQLPEEAEDLYGPTVTIESTAPLDVPLSIIVDEQDDYDSTYGDSESVTMSLDDSVTDYVFENGRRYHSFMAGRYLMPNDEQEMDREDMKHHISILLTEGRLNLAPISPNCMKILDIGTGTGIWAIQMAECLPGAEVIATDLSAIQPHW
jgi:hypothetical protein